MSMRALLNVATSLDSKYTFVVDNKTGNAGLIGMEALAEADPDGYTLGTTNIDLLLHICFGRTDVTMDNYIPIAATMADPLCAGHQRFQPQLLQPGGVCGVRQGQPRCCEDG